MRLGATDEVASVSAEFARRPTSLKAAISTRFSYFSWLPAIRSVFRSAWSIWLDETCNVPDAERYCSTWPSISNFSTRKAEASIGLGRKHALRIEGDVPGLSALQRRAMLCTAVAFLAVAGAVFMEMVALLARKRKWRRDRAALAKMDYAALRDIGFTSAPWNADPGPGDRSICDIAWSSDKRLRALLDDCSRSRKAARASARQNRVNESGSLDGSLRAGRIPRVTEIDPSSDTCS